MADNLSMADKIERARAMSRLPHSERLVAIAAASNVIGFDRFSDRAKQQRLATSYRAPRAPFRPNR